MAAAVNSVSLPSSPPSTTHIHRELFYFSFEIKLSVTYLALGNNSIFQHDLIHSSRCCTGATPKDKDRNEARRLTRQPLPHTIHAVQYAFAYLGFMHAGQVSWRLHLGRAAI